MLLPATWLFERQLASYPDSRARLETWNRFKPELNSRQCRKLLGQSGDSGCSQRGHKAVNTTKRLLELIGRILLNIALLLLRRVIIVTVWQNKYKKPEGFLHLEKKGLSDCFFYYQTVLNIAGCYSLSKIVNWTGQNMFYSLSGKLI